MKKLLILLLTVSALFGQFKFQRSLPDRYTVLDIRGNSYNNGNIIDYSYNTKTVTAYNSPSATTDYKYIGNKSIYFSRTNNSYLNIPTSSLDYNFGTEDMSCEMIFLNNYSAGYGNRALIFYQPLYIMTVNNESHWMYAVYNTAGTVIVNHSNQNMHVNNIGAWVSIVCERINDSFFVYVNNQLISKDYIGSNDIYYSSSNSFNLFSYANNKYPMEGYLSRFRMSKKARFYGKNYYLGNR